MSTSEGDRKQRGFDGLDAAVTGAVNRIRELEEALRRTRTRRDEVEELLRRMTAGEENPARMAERLQTLEAENKELRRRIEEGGTAVDRLLARVRYLEDHG